MSYRPRSTRRNSPATAPTPRGTGRATRGIPGTFAQTEFRSQLEIRFVKQLEQREWKWFYEPERLGTLRYLVDFFIPAAKCWVEVKGVLNTRDHEALREVAALIDREYHHALYMFTSDNCYRVCEEGFIRITQDTFWRELEDRRLGKHIPDTCERVDPALVWDSIGNAAAAPDRTATDAG